MFHRAKRLVTRVFRDRRGSALPLMAAALIPTMLTIGGGIDMARAYMVKSKLQEAVDSAALAGRRSMTKEDLESAKADITAFIKFNFPSGTYEITLADPVITKPEVGTVRVAVTATVKTTIMSLAGIKSIPISVVGEAKQNFDNVDIVLVLDTTGSMAGSRLTGLKDAVRALYDELEDAQAELTKQGLRMRYGIVPYSSTVNVGKVLLGKSSSYIQTADVPYYHDYKSNGSWYFGQRKYNLLNYVNGSKLGNINGNSDQKDAYWAGCIEERKTINTITATDSRTGAPTGAYDLDIDMIPDGTADTQWKPFIYDPRDKDPNSECPSEAVPLKVMSESELETELGKLVAVGVTYHDIGMIWGTRFISNGGVFGADNPNEYNKRTVQRYIIYMTDGDMNTPLNRYSAWGLENSDKRVGGTSDSDNDNRHTKRFLMACNEAKARKVSIWTISFGSDVAALKNCASNADQSSVAKDSAALIAKFAEIGRNIGPLRISK